MKIFFIIPVILLLAGCNMMRRLEDSVYIQQRTSAITDFPPMDSLLIVANGNSSTQRIMDEVMPHFIERLKQRGVASRSVFISYSHRRINEAEFKNDNYNYTLWIYEQDRDLQKLNDYTYLIPLAMKLTNNRTGENIWIATSIYNDYVKKKFYKERYAGTLALLFRASGLIK